MKWLKCYSKGNEDPFLGSFIKKRLVNVERKLVFIIEWEIPGRDSVIRLLISHLGAIVDYLHRFIDRNNRCD